MTNQSDIIHYLKTKTNDLGFIDRLKVGYRPLICPFDILLNYVSKTDSVFDIGCGSGQFCSLVAQFTVATKIYGIEISELLVANAKIVNEDFGNKKEMHFSSFDGQQIPTIIQDFSKVFLIDVLHHISKKKQVAFLSEIYSKMSTGSTLILKDIDAGSTLVYANKLHDLVFSQEIGNEMGSDFAKQTVEKIGFKVLDNFKKRLVVYPHYFLILQK